MPIPVLCACGKKISAPSKLAGKKVKCPACSQPLVVPAAANGKSSNGKSGSAIPVQCECGKSFRAPAKAAGRKVKCPGCDSAITVPARKAKQKQKAAVAASVETDSSVGSLLDEIGFQQAGGAGCCPSCKTDLLDDAVLCIECGYNLETGKMMKSRVKRAAQDEVVDDGIAPDHIKNAVEGKGPGVPKALVLLVLLVVLGAVFALRMGLIPGLPGSGG